MPLTRRVLTPVLHAVISPVLEVLGPELVTGTDSDMSGANSWFDDGLNTFDIDSTVADKMYIKGGGIADYCTLSGVFLPTHRHYRVSLKARLNAGISTTIAIGGGGWYVPANLFEFTPTGTETTFTGYIFSGGGLTLALGDGITKFPDVAFEIDAVSVREVY